MKTLIAEDDPVSRLILEAQLSKWGYEVVAACDGQEAWEILHSDDAPRLAILDWMMPGLDGVEVCRRVRKEAKEPAIYLMLLTSCSGEDAVVECLGAGADDFIVKPFRAAELQVRLRAARRILELQDQLIAAREALRSG